MKTPFSPFQYMVGFMECFHTLLSACMLLFDVDVNLRPRWLLSALHKHYEECILRILVSQPSD